MPAVSGSDRLHRPAVAMQEAFATLAEQQRGLVGETGLRVAVNTGEVVIKGEVETERPLVGGVLIAEEVEVDDTVAADGAVLADKIKIEVEEDDDD